MRQTQASKVLIANALAGAVLAPTAAQVTSATTAVGVGTATDGGAAWTVNQWAGYYFNDSAGHKYPILSNTATVLTLDTTGLPGTPTAGAYTITNDDALTTGKSLASLSEHSIMKPAKWLVEVKVGGTGSVKVQLWGRDFQLNATGTGAAAGDWGYVGVNKGYLNGGSPIAAGETYHFVVSDVGVLRDLAVAVPSGDVVGAPTTTVYVSEVLENSLARGD